MLSKQNVAFRSNDLVVLFYLPPIGVAPAMMEHRHFRLSSDMPACELLSIALLMNATKKN